MTNAIRCLLPLLALAGSAAGAPPPQDAASLLAAQRAGLGEAEALAALGVVRSRGTLVFEGFAGEGEFVELVAPGGAARIEAAFAGAPPSQTCSNGELYWMTGTGGVEIKKGWSAAADARLFALARHRDWREIYAGAELVGEAEVLGRRCHELRLVPKAPAELGIEAVPGEQPPAPDTWWLDAKTKELVQVALWATVSGAGWQRLVLGWSDWRTVRGVRFPFQSSTTFGPPEHPVTIRSTRKTLEVDVEVAAAAFQPDEPVFRELAKLRSGAASEDPGFELRQGKAAATATVRVKCKPADLHQQLATILPEVMGYLSRERLAPAGPPFARFHSFDELVDLEAGIPVAQPIAGNGRVKPSSLPGGDVVAGMHVGPYHELHRTHEALVDWLAGHGLVAEGGAWEVFWTDPGLERDPSKWRTEVFQPVSAASAAAARAAAGADTGATRRVSGAGPLAAPERDPRLERLGKLALGTWKVDGGADGPNGTIVFEWLEGGYFLVQRVDLVHGEHVIKGIEIIGRERPFGVEPKSTDLRSRFYDNLGNTLDYVWVLEGNALTIWGGEKGSPASFRGAFSEDGNTLSGGWTWPGGGFELVGTRVRGGGGAQ
jgi:effector-binding domain-containing protein